MAKKNEKIIPAGAIKFEPQQFDAATSIFESENIWVPINRDPNF